MSLGRCYQIVCDKCGCATPLENSGKDARSEAKRYGWSRVVPKRSRRWKRKPPIDNCPDCTRVRIRVATDTQDGGANA